MAGPCPPRQARQSVPPLQLLAERREGRSIPERSSRRHQSDPLSLQTGDQRTPAGKYLTGGFGGLLGFELAGGREAGRCFIDALQLLYHVANIGDARSLAIHPASTTHSQLSPDDRAATGVFEGYVRLSVGLEHIDDILADIGQALDKAAP